MSLILRRALPYEAGTLSKVAIASKAHWGYSEEFMAACRDELVVTEKHLTQPGGTPVVSELDERVNGFYLLVDEGIQGDRQQWDLDAMFVHPRAIGTGVGRALFNDALDRVRRAGGGRLVIQSDPNAEGFYLAMGATRVGEKASGSIAGRLLPLLACEVEGA